MIKLCNISDLVEGSGVCALTNHDNQEQQIALFYLPNTEQKVYAINNWDPCGNANVLSRGIVGNVGEELVVASPLYKQHFNLITGQCLEEEQTMVKTYPLTIKDDGVYLTAA